MEGKSLEDINFEINQIIEKEQNNIKPNYDDIISNKTFTKKTGNNKIIKISQSDIKVFLKKGNEIDHCSKKYYHTRIIKDIKNFTTESMFKGLFFETKCLGSSARGEKIEDLPRKKVSAKKLKLNPLIIGDKSADQIRIEEQIMMFKKKCIDYGVVINAIATENSPSNVQVKLEKEWKHPNFPNSFPEMNIIVTMEADMISPINFKNRAYTLAVIDLKLTKNRNSEFGDYCWGFPQYMDHIQALIYNWVTGYPFIYWVFDYQANDEERGDKIIPKIIDSTEVTEMHESIRKTVSYILDYEQKGWPTNPIYDICKQCMMNPKHGGECKDCESIQDV